jgi:hypothetical protein
MVAVKQSRADRFDEQKCEQDPETVHRVGQAIAFMTSGGFPFASFGIILYV